MENIKFVKCRDVKSPNRAHLTDSGIDGFIPNDLIEAKVTPWELGKINEVIKTGKGNKGFLINSGEGILIPSGIKMIIPEGYEVVLYNKSGIATKKGLIVGAQVIDSGYTGEVHYHLINTSNISIFIELGEKIVQGIIRKIENWIPKEINEEEFLELVKQKDRGNNGFGSSGTK